MGMNFGDVVKKQRQLHGMSRYDLATKMNMSVESVKRLEEGKAYRNHFVFIRQLSSALKMPIHVLFTLDEKTYEE